MESDRYGLTFQNHDGPLRFEIGANLKDNGVAGQVDCDGKPGLVATHSERVFQLFQSAVERKVASAGIGSEIVCQLSNQYCGGAWFKLNESEEYLITFSMAESGRS